MEKGGWVGVMLHHTTKNPAIYINNNNLFLILKLFLLYALHSTLSSPNFSCSCFQGGIVSVPERFITFDLFVNVLTTQYNLLKQYYNAHSYISYRRLTNHLCGALFN